MLGIDQKLTNSRWKNYIDRAIKDNNDVILEYKRLVTNFIPNDEKIWDKLEHMSEDIKMTSMNVRLVGYMIETRNLRDCYKKDNEMRRVTKFNS